MRRLASVRRRRRREAEEEKNGHGKREWSSERWWDGMEMEG